MPECLKYSIDSNGIAVTIWGKGREVFTVAFEGSNPIKAEAKIAEQFPIIKVGRPENDIPLSFAHYLESGEFEPVLEPVFLWGTPFQLAVWNELLKIKKGEFAYYCDIAEAVGNYGAARAVGRAVGANPIPLLVPCHRVFAVGNLGGYTGGLNIKRKLLGIEGFPLVEKIGFSA